MDKLLQDLLKAQKNAVYFWLLPIFFLTCVSYFLMLYQNNQVVFISVLSVAILALLVGFIRAVYFFFKFCFYLDRDK